MCPSATMIPWYLNSTSVKPRIICHIHWHFLQDLFLPCECPRPSISAPSFCEPSLADSCLPMALCLDGAPKTLPPWENGPQSPAASNFHLLSPSLFSEQSWVFDFVFYEVWLFLASFPIMPLSFKSIFLRIYEVVYRAYLWSKLCGFYIYLIRG